MVERAGVRTLDRLTKVWPHPRVWGMGFSWPSYIAQSSLLEACAMADLDEARVLPHGKPVPCKPGVFLSLATDDTLIFSKTGAVYHRLFYKQHFEYPPPLNH